MTANSEEAEPVDADPGVFVVLRAFLLEMADNCRLYIRICACNNSFNTREECGLSVRASAGGIVNEEIIKA